MRRIIAFTAACTLLCSCSDHIPMPDQAGIVTEVHEVAIKDIEHSGNYSMSSSGGSGGAVLIVLAAVGTMAIIDALSEPDLHPRKAFEYNVRLQSGKEETLLVDMNDSRLVIEPGQWMILHYGKGDPDGKHCGKPLPADPQGTAVLLMKSCNFVKCPHECRIQP